MPAVIDWNPTVDPSELVRQVARRARRRVGRRVAGRLRISRTVEAPGTRSNYLPGVLAWGPDEVAALGLTVPPAARRLMFARGPRRS